MWYGAVLRGKQAHKLYAMALPRIPCCRVILHHVTAGDVNHIKIGDNSNVQDNVVVHVAKHNAADRALPTIIGNNVTIGMSCGSYRSLCNSNSQCM